ncbi:MAG: glycosyltransferase [Flavobacteriaceae bacterium]|nr:glycosyltransferase [Flavobacteriaceae bacterium]
MNLIIQTCIPDYRVKVYNYILENNKTVSILSGKEYYTPSIKSVDSVASVSWVNNHFFFKRRFLFQCLPMYKIFKAKNVVIEFNLRNISFYPIVIIRFLLRKKIYLWGHAWSRSGKNSKTEFIRLLFKRIANGYITYTEEQKEELQAQLKNKNIYAACNAVYFEDEMKPLSQPLDKIVNFIYVGRLVKEKRPLLLLQAFYNVLNRLPKESKLLIVGNGPEFDILNAFIDKHNIEHRVVLYGHISDYKIIRELYSTSIASVSPGYVGLSITQSLGFGVPMIISKDEPHSPELEAAILGENSEYFKTESIDNLSDKISSFYLYKDKWYSKRNEISEICRNMYSVEKMAEPFLKIFKD